MTQDEQLEHERHVAAILAIRQPPRDRESTLRTWLNSNVMTAMVGVIGTAIVGTLLSGIIQDRSRNNELDRTSRLAKLESQNAAVDKVLQRAGAFLSATDDMFVTINTMFSETGRDADEMKKLLTWKEQIRERRDTADREWRRDKRSLGFTLHYLFDGDRAIDEAWREVLRTADAFELCTSDWYFRNAEQGTTLDAVAICPEARKDFEDRIETLTAAVTRARQDEATRVAATIGDYAYAAARGAAVLGFVALGIALWLLFALTHRRAPVPRTE
jgi:hypothetical protein